MKNRPNKQVMTKRSMNKKKRTIIISVFAAICVSLLGAYFGTHSVTRNLKKYHAWDEKEILGALKIFPDTLENMGAEKYYYKCVEGLLDSSCQIYLECQLTEDMFEAEKSRLSEISDTYEKEVQQIAYDTENFRFPAYVTTYNFDSTYEYALLDEEQKKIYYVHLQFVPEKDIKFDNALLPREYLPESSEGMDIYAHWISDLEGWYYND